MLSLNAQAAQEAFSSSISITVVDCAFRASCSDRNNKQIASSNNNLLLF